jgi:hypothetical protein
MVSPLLWSMPPATNGSGEDVVVGSTAGGERCVLLQGGKFHWRTDAPARLMGHGRGASVMDAPSPWIGEGLARKPFAGLLLHRGKSPY